MNLSKLFEIQKVLDDRIVEEHGLQGQDLLDKKILALQVELGELANEWRGFKFWSKNQEPKRTFLTTAGATKENAVEYICANDDCGNIFNADDENLKDIWGSISEDCPDCEVGHLYPMRSKNPLLEEYVDCLHFILSIGLELGITSVDVAEMGDYTEETTTKTFISIQSDIIAIVDDLETDIFNKFAQEDYKTLLARFVGLGELQLGFTWEQIEQSYMNKNKINHTRQDSGY